jgi:hypothetical protein
VRAMVVDGVRWWRRVRVERVSSRVVKVAARV